MIHAIGEAEAAEKLAEAARVLSGQDQAVQLRYLQTLVEIAGDKSSTIVFRCRSMCSPSSRSEHCVSDAIGRRGGQPPPPSRRPA